MTEELKPISSMAERGTLTADTGVRFPDRLG